MELEVGLLEYIYIHTLGSLGSLGWLYVRQNDASPMKSIWGEEKTQTPQSTAVFTNRAGSILEYSEEHPRTSPLSGFRIRTDPTRHERDDAKNHHIRRVWALWLDGSCSVNVCNYTQTQPMGLP